MSFYVSRVEWGFFITLAGGFLQWCITRGLYFDSVLRGGVNVTLSLLLFLTFGGHFGMIFFPTALTFVVTGICTHSSEQHRHRGWFLSASVVCALLSFVFGFFTGPSFTPVSSISFLDTVFLTMTSMLSLWGLGLIDSLFGCILGVLFCSFHFFAPLALLSCMLSCAVDFSSGWSYLESALIVAKRGPSTNLQALSMFMCVSTAACVTSLVNIATGGFYACVGICVSFMLVTLVLLDGDTLRHLFFYFWHQMTIK